MVAARQRVLGSGLYAPIAAAIVDNLPAEANVIVDAGAGTGYYLSQALAAAPSALGVGIDLSKFCGRAIARSHPRALGVVADLWEPLPVRDDAVDAVLSVFAPRNAAETKRVLAPGGRWILVTPQPEHLAQLREPLGMLDIGDDKLAKLHAELAAAGFDVTATASVRAPMELTTELAADLAGMGPAGFHRTTEELTAAASALTATGPVTAELAVSITVAEVA